MSDNNLEFEGLGFTDDSLKRVRNLELAESVALWSTGITDRGCKELLRARALSQFCVSSDSLSDPLLDVLAQLPSLRSLQVHRGPKITDTGVKVLARCDQLRELYLKKTAVTDTGLAAIGTLPNIWSLVLDDTAITDKGISTLAGMPKLSLLSIERTKVSGHGLASLHDNDLDVYLTGAPATDEGVAVFVKRLRRMRRVGLNDTGVGDDAARALASLARLEDARLSRSKVTDAGAIAFRGHRTLEVLYVEGCRVTKETVTDLKKSSPKELTVYGP